LGLELANWLVLRGAKKLVLSSRFGLKNGYQTQRVNSLKSRRVSVHISTSDVCSKSGCLSLIQEANELGPVDGIFNLAMVLKDGLFENQRVENFTACLAPKVQSSKHLDEITRRSCPPIKIFHCVLFVFLWTRLSRPNQLRNGEFRHGENLRKAQTRWFSSLGDPMERYRRSTL
jgi:hypothetical protein